MCLKINLSKQIPQYQSCLPGETIVHSKATKKLIHIAENMLLKGLWSLSVCLKNVSSLISKKLPRSHMKRSHCQISSVCTQGLLEKRPTEFVRIATKKFLYGRHAIALKFTIFMYLQKKTIYLSSLVPENPHWNLSCITKIRKFSSKDQREAKSLQNINKHTNLIQGSLTPLCFSCSGQLLLPHFIHWYTPHLQHS